MTKKTEFATWKSLDPKPKSVEILHIEDDSSFAEMVATFLERERETFNVRTETDPTAALTALRDGDVKCDCIVSDYEMPGRNGLEVLTAVRATFPDLPFILFTGKGSEAVASDAVSAGVTDYVQKGGGRSQFQVLANRIHNAVERHRAEQCVNRGLQAIETAQDAISILDEDGYVTYANEACGSLLGYDRDTLIGMHWEAFYDEEDVSRVYEDILPTARDDRWNGHTQLLRQDGTPIEVEHTLTYADDGSLICTLSNPSPTESAIRDRFAKELATAEAPVGIIITDPHREDNPIVYANERFAELTGYERSEVIGRNCRFLQGDQTRSAAVRRMRTAIQRREPVTVDVRNYRADGNEFWNRARIAPVFDDDGDIDLFVGFQEDITAQKRHEQQLRATTARLEALFENSPDLIAVHDSEGMVRDVNDRMCRDLGYTKAELVGKTVWDLDPTADPEQARSFWNELPTGSPRRFEGELERKDGSTFPIEIHLVRLDLDGDDRFVAMDRDISEQREREAALRRQNERLDRFTSVVSHDLRNPLQVAKGRLTLLKADCDSEHIEDIEMALDRMDALIEDLLTLAQDGDAAMELVPVEVAELARTCWETVATRGATLAIETELTVEADRDQLQQLFENLVRNAVEHGGDDVTVTIGDVDGGIYVEDDGRGVPADEPEAIFETGYSTASDGTGFGLSIVEQIVEAHGWTITVTTSQAGGARFEIRGI